MKRETLTVAQERKLLKFIEEDPHFSRYYDGIFILFNTGLRISEFCGLTVSDINMHDRSINIDHQLRRGSDMKYYIETPKTEAGKRTLPMTSEVYEAFCRILDKRKSPKIESALDGYHGFLFYDKNRKPLVALHWEKYLEHIVYKYNTIYKEEMPKVTPHVCRHTYCTKMARSGVSPKTLQYLMGHSDISVTLNVYTHIRYDDAREEVKKLERSCKCVC